MINKMNDNNQEIPPNATIRQEYGVVILIVKNHMVHISMPIGKAQFIWS
jgi:hypothetical protein